MVAESRADGQIATVLGKADVNARDSSGKTALHRAVNNYEEEIEVVKVLCENGADVSAKDSDGFTPLHEAAGGKKDIVEMLLVWCRPKRRG